MSKKKDRNEGAWRLSEPRGLAGRKQREVKLLAILPYLVVKRERAILLLEWIRNNGSMTKEQKLALAAYRFALQQEDRYLGSVFANAHGQKKYEAMTKSAYDKGKRWGTACWH